MSCTNEMGCKLLNGDIEFGEAALAIVRMRFCDREWQRCARFVFKKVACEEGPADLLPNDTALLDELLKI